jgi:hypothetical protein
LKTGRSSRFSIPSFIGVIGFQFMHDDKATKSLSCSDKLLNVELQRGEASGFSPRKVKDIVRAAKSALKGC